MAVLTVYPDPHPESTTVDGHVYQWGGDISYAALRGAAGRDASPDAGVEYFYLNSGSTEDGWWQLSRAIFLFNTSSIPVGATVDSATFSLRIDNKYNGFSGNSFGFNLVSASPDSNTSLVGTDYALAHFGSTRFASAISHSSLSTSVYNNFSLNSSGIANVTKGGISKFGLREDTYDIGNTPPTWESSKEMNISPYYADWTGTTNAPKLVVNYTLPGPTGVKTINGLAAASVKTDNGLAIGSVKTWNG